MRKLLIILISGFLSLAALADQKFGFQELEALILKKDVKSVDDLIPLLPKSMRSSFTLMHDSAGLQKASPEFPRAILFGLDARLIVAFNGSPKHPGYNTIETIEYDPPTASFSLRQITFPKGPGDKVEFSEANPPRCLKCHQQDPRPNWELAARWTGAWDHNEQPLSGEDLKTFRDFQAGNAKKPPYVSLLPPEGAQLSPFWGEDDPVDYRFMPNNRLGKILLRYQADRALRIIKKSPQFERYKELLLITTLAIYEETLAPGCAFTKTQKEQIGDLIEAELKSAGIDIGMPVVNRSEKYASFSQPALFSILEASPKDASLEFRTKPERIYNDGYHRLDEIMMGKLFESYLKEYPELDRIYSLKPLSKDFEEEGSPAYVYYRYMPEFMAFLDHAGVALSDRPRQQRTECYTDLKAAILRKWPIGP
jgi:hypothetical protein